MTLPLNSELHTQLVLRVLLNPCWVLRRSHGADLGFLGWVQMHAWGPFHTGSVTASLHPGSHHTLPDYSTFLEP